MEVTERKPVKLPKYVSSFVFEITVTPAMSPISRVLVYYVREDGETVADSMNVNIKKCLQNKVFSAVPASLCLCISLALFWPRNDESLLSVTTLT